MVDPGRVVALLERLGAEVKAIRQSAARPDEVLHSAEDALPALKYRLMIAVEAAVNIADHIIASEDQRPHPARRPRYLLHGHRPEIGLRF